MIGRQQTKGTAWDEYIIFCSGMVSGLILYALGIYWPLFALPIVGVFWTLWRVRRLNGLKQTLRFSVAFLMGIGCLAGLKGCAQLKNTETGKAFTQRVKNLDKKGARLIEKELKRVDKKISKKLK